MVWLGAADGAAPEPRTPRSTMRVVALIRVSTERQAEQGASLDAQERAYHAMAAKEGWETVAVFRGHESASQASADRRLLLQVLACIQEQEVSAVWVFEQSRLTRGDQFEVALLMRALTDNGVKILVNGILRDPASIDDGLMLRLQSLLDYTEGRRIKERMTRGKREMARKGKRNNGPPPYGYRNPRGDEPGATRGVLQIVEEQAAVVRRIFESFAKGTSANRIATDLNKLGIPSPRGIKWGQATVRNMLLNPIYIGVQASYVWKKEAGVRTSRRDLNRPDSIVVPDAHPPIISREVWDAARARPKQPQTRTPRMLAGLLHVNGVRFGGFSDHGKRQYRATSRRAGTGWLRCDETDDRVWDAFAALATGPEFVAGLLERAQNPHEQRMVEMEIEHLEDQLGRHERRLGRLVDMRADGEISREEFAKRRETETATIERLGAELAEQRAKVVVLDGTHAARIVRAVQSLIAGRTRLTTDQKRRVLTSIVRRVDVEAVRVKRPFKRDEQGRILPGQCASWEIRKIEFGLVLPPEDAASGAPREPGGRSPDAALGRETGLGGLSGDTRLCQSVRDS